jgi:hypothetical protein
MSEQRFSIPNLYVAPKGLWRFYGFRTINMTLSGELRNHGAPLRLLDRE